MAPSSNIGTTNAIPGVHTIAQLYHCAEGILSFSFLKLLCFYPLEGHPLHSSIILTWEARNDPDGLSKGYKSVKSWTGSLRETEGFFPARQEVLMTSRQVKTTQYTSLIYDVYVRLLPGCLLVRRACVGTPSSTPSRPSQPPSRLGLPPSRLGLPPSRLGLPPSHQLPTTTRQPQGEGGQEGALAGVHHLHLLRRGPRGLPCY